MNRLQKKLLSMLDEFIEVCNSHDLEYMLDGGTLLGAVREHGFIPWDDDIDILMPRADYNILIENPQWFKKPLKLLSIRSEYAISNAELIDESTTLLSKIDVEFRCFNGGFFIPPTVKIDINSIEHLPEDSTSIDEMSGFIKTICRNCTVRLYTKKESNMYLTRQKAKLFSELYTTMMTDIDMMNASSNVVSCVNYWQFSAYDKQVYPRTMLETHEVDFEGLTHKAKITNEWKKVLVNYYGEDFMTPVKNASGHEYLGGRLLDLDKSYKKYEILDSNYLIKLIDNFKGEEK